MWGMCVTEAGREIQIRIVTNGERYGPDNALRHRRAEPLVEFYLRNEDLQGGRGGDGFLARYEAGNLIHHFLQYPASGLSIPGIRGEAWVLSPASLQHALKAAVRGWANKNYVRITGEHWLQA